MQPGNPGTGGMDFSRQQLHAAVAMNMNMLHGANGAAGGAVGGADGCIAMADGGMWLKQAAQVNAMMGGALNLSRDAPPLC